MTGHHWITFHRLRFPVSISARDRVFDAPDGPEVWRFCPDMALGDGGLPTWVSDVWGGFALHAEESGARRMFDKPDAALPWMSEATEAWHALAVPEAHHGTVRWCETPQTDCAIRPGRPDRTSTLAVMTTAGIDVTGPEDRLRVRQFMAGVAEVVEFYGTLPGNLRRAVFNGGFDGLDGFTLTLWRDDRSMIGAAYKDGVHRDKMAPAAEARLMDRSSFTRARVLETRGSWNGDAMAG